MKLDYTTHIARLLEFCRTHEIIYCYGAGETAFYVSLYLRLHGVMPRAFIVSAGERVTECYLGCPVYSFATLPQQRGDERIVFSLKQEVAWKICAHLPSAWAGRTFVAETSLVEEIKHALGNWVRSVQGAKEWLGGETGVLQQALVFAFSETVQRSGEEFLHQVVQMTRQMPVMCFFAQKARLKDVARYTPLELTEWLPWKALRIADAASFLFMYEEIFVKQIYAFEWPANEDGVILDFGANIGLSALFFASVYPHAHIEAYEADPAIFELLRWNLEQAGVSSVALYNRAVWKENGTLQFRQEGADGGCITLEPENSLLIEAEDVCSILRRHARIAFLKMDIEGAEREVLARARQELARVERIFVEYHGAADEKPWLSEVLHILEESGFRIDVHADMAPMQPLKAVNTGGPYELQINIFGVRRSESKSERGKRLWD